MTFRLTEDFKTIEELREAPDAIVRRVRDSGNPAVITVRGKPAVVMMTASQYEDLVHHLELASALLKGESDIRAGRTRPAEEFFAELLNEKPRAKKVSRRNHAGRRS